MGEMKPIMRPADIRRAVSEWAAQGFSVTVKADGEITVVPPGQTRPADSFDLLDFKR